MKLLKLIKGFMEEKKIIEEIKKNITEKIRPILINDGGNIEFVNYDNKTGIVKVKLLGHCHGCPFASITLKNAVQEIFRSGSYC